MDPSNTACALLVINTSLKILPSASPSIGRSITAPAAVTVTSPPADSNSGNAITTWFNSYIFRTNNGKKLSDSGYGSGSGGSINSGNSGSGGGGGDDDSDIEVDVDVDSDDEKGFKNGTSGISGSEVTTPISATSTSSASLYNIGTAMKNWWFQPQTEGTPVDMKGSTVDPVIPKQTRNTTNEGPTTSIKSKPVIPIGRLLPKSIDTPQLNIILRVQPSSGYQNDIDQLDVYIHPSTLPSLYTRRPNGQEEWSIHYLVKLQKVSLPEKPNKKHAKSEQEDENFSSSQSSSPVENKGVIKSLVVRVCLGSPSSTQGSSLHIKPGHIVISDSVRRQMAIRDCSRVRLTEITENMRIPCHDHSIKLTPLNNTKVSIKAELDVRNKYVVHG